MDKTSFQQVSWQGFEFAHAQSVLLIALLLTYRVHSFCNQNENIVSSIASNIALCPTDDAR